MKRVWLVLLAGCAAAPPARYSGEIRDERHVFVIYGDTREIVALEVWRERADRERNLVAARLAELRPDFILNTGDLTACGSSASRWEFFDRELAAVREAGIPYFPGLGNHEYMGDRDRAMANYFARFPFLGGRKWYDLRYRGVLILVLDSNRDELSSAERDEQLRWLGVQLAAAKDDASVRAVFLTTHHPPFTNAGLVPDDARVQETFVAAAKRCPKVKVFWSGHVHSYERFFQDGIHFVVTGGGGAPLMSVHAGKRHPDLYGGPRRFHYCLVTVGDAITVDVEMLDEEGRWSRVDGFTIE